MSGYFLASLEQFLVSYPAKVLIVRWDVNPVAPFDFIIPEGAEFVSRSTLKYKELKSLVESYSPDLVLCGGWADGAYFRLAREFNKKFKFILALDNHWLGTPRQRVMGLTAGGYISRVFQIVWIPGIPQYEFVRRLGFKNYQIRFGFYSCDFKLFDGGFKNASPDRFPRKFWYVGRFVEEKGLLDLLEAFNNEPYFHENDWKLRVIGNGDLEPQLRMSANIEILPFKQPNDLADLAKEGGVFVLPSHYEAWGVVVQEFAASGFPLVCSWDVGAGTAFLKNGFNGYAHFKRNPLSLRKSMLKMATSSDVDLWKMANRSRQMANSITPEIWASDLWTMIVG